MPAPCQAACCKAASDGQTVASSARTLSSTATKRNSLRPRTAAPTKRPSTTTTCDLFIGSPVEKRVSNRLRLAPSGSAGPTSPTGVRTGPLDHSRSDRHPRVHSNHCSEKIWLFSVPATAEAVAVGRLHLGRRGDNSPRSSPPIPQRRNGRAGRRCGMGGDDRGEL
eukprot:gene32393-43277_t